MPDSPTSPAGIPSPTDPLVAETVSRWVEAAGDDHATALAGVVAAVARARGVEVDLVVRGSAVRPSSRVAGVEVDPGVLCAHGPWLPGFVRESLLSSPERTRRGVHHTAPSVAAAIVSLAVDELDDREHVLVGDPAVGGGAFLLAACEILEGSPEARVAQVVGCDIDPLSVAVTTAALQLWADGAPVPEDALRVADFLEPDPFARAPSLVVGNPPFLSQLRGAGVRDGRARDGLRRRWPDVGGYVDDAAAFLLAALDVVDDAGVVALMQPSSFLSARDARAVRARITRSAALVALWVDGGRRFEAEVDTVAPVLRRGGRPGRVRRVVGLHGDELPPTVLPGDDSWAPLVAEVAGVPPIEPAALDVGRTLGEVARVTAGFRDEYYGLRAGVHEDHAGVHRLITSGLIDPLEPQWGVRRCRFDHRRWLHPVVDLSAVDAGTHGWVADRLVPKLLVASQTKTIEVIVDAEGEWVPCTPVVTVEPGEGAPTLWHLAAALSSPVAAALIVRGAAGSALSPDAVRVSAPTLRALPLPAPGHRWDAAAAAAAEMQAAPDRTRLVALGRLTLAAYGVEDRDDLAEWWARRLPVSGRG